MVDKKYARFIQNARSYNNINTDSDHNLIHVIANIKLELSKLNISSETKTPKLIQQILEMHSYIKNIVTKWRKSTTTKTSKTMMINDSVYLPKSGSRSFGYKRQGKEIKRLRNVANNQTPNDR